MCCVSELALNGGVRVILTSAVLRTVENSRIKACAHWENANWKTAVHNTSSSLLLTSCQHNISLLSPSEQGAKSFFCRTLYPSLETTTFSWSTAIPMVGHAAAAENGELFGTSVCIHSFNFAMGRRIKVRCHFHQMWRQILNFNEALTLSTSHPHLNLVNQRQHCAPGGRH